MTALSGAHASSWVEWLNTGRVTGLLKKITPTAEFCNNQYPKRIRLCQMAKARVNIGHFLRCHHPAHTSPEEAAERYGFVNI